MLYRYRCWKRMADGKKCGGRKTLKKMIAFYVREPKCPNCGNKTLVLDRHRMENEVGGNKPACHCDGYHFPHRRGSKWCVHSTSLPTDEDYEDRHRSMPANL